MVDMRYWRGILEAGWVLIRWKASMGKVVGFILYLYLPVSEPVSGLGCDMASAHLYISITTQLHYHTGFMSLLMAEMSWTNWDHTSPVDAVVKSYKYFAHWAIATVALYWLRRSCSPCNSNEIGNHFCGKLHEKMCKLL